MIAVGSTPDTLTMSNQRNSLNVRFMAFLLRPHGPTDTGASDRILIYQQTYAPQHGLNCYKRVRAQKADDSTAVSCAAAERFVKRKLTLWFAQRRELRLRGFEPPHLSVPDPKSGASANSATAATWRRAKGLNSTLLSSIPAPFSKAARVERKERQATLFASRSPQSAARKAST
jgi:hypothetical protein